MKGEVRSATSGVRRAVRPFAFVLAAAITVLAVPAWARQAAGATEVKSSWWADNPATFYTEARLRFPVEPSSFATRGWGSH